MRWPWLVLPLCLICFMGAVIALRKEVRTPPNSAEPTEIAPPDASVPTESAPVLPAAPAAKNDGSGKAIESWQAEVETVLKTEIAKLKEPPLRVVLSFDVKEDGALANVQAHSTLDQGDAERKAARDLVDAIGRARVPPPPDRHLHQFAVPVTFGG